ncbi:MAG: DUF4115 domain-containing protein [Bryobacterales bacterium]|nr:DUF4115 domain-containing protein [Bryobacterales bacterium]
MTLAQVADRTRIKQHYLQALEQDDFDRLPGRFFARSFTHQYANVLGVNTPELQARLQATVAPVEIFGSGSESNQSGWVEEQSFSVEPLPNGSAASLNARKLTASVVMLVAAVVACGTVFWLWQSAQLQTSAANTNTPVPPVAAPVAQVNPPKPAAVPESVSPPAAQPTNGDAKVDPAKSESTPTVSPAVSESSAAPTTPPPAAAQVPGKLNLSVTAKEDVWLRIRVDGKVITERKLDPGETVTIAGDESASIFTGNAGGLAVRFNGSDIGIVGPRGQVRTVEFTRDAFKILEPQKKAPAATENRPTPVALLE